MTVLFVRDIIATERYEGGWHSPEREVLPMITYTEFFQFCLVIVAIVSLLVQIFHDKNK